MRILCRGQAIYSLRWPVIIKYLKAESDNSALRLGWWIYSWIAWFIQTTIHGWFEITSFYLSTQMLFLLI